MNMIASVWRKVSCMGIEPDMPGFERVRVRFVNQFLLANLLLCAFGSIVYGILGSEHMLLVLLLGSLIIVFEMAMCWLGFALLTRHIFIAVYPFFFVLSVLLTGEIVSFAIIYMPVLTIVTFLFKSKYTRFGYTIVFLLSLIPAFLLRVENPPFPIDEKVAVRLLSFLSAFALQTTLLLIYSNEIANFIDRQHRSKNFLRSSQRLAMLGSWEHYIEEDRVVISDQLAGMFGLRKKSFTSKELMENCAPLEPIFMLEFNENIGSNFHYHYSERDGGTIKWYEIRSKLVRKEESSTLKAIGTVQEVSERLNSQKEMTDSVSVLEATLESTTDGLLVVNNTQEIIRFNKQFTKIWNFPVELMEIGEGRKFFRFAIKHVVNKKEFLAQVERTYLQKGSIFFNDIILKNGKILEIYSMPLIENGEFTGRVWSFRDATERKKNEQKIKELLESLQQQNTLLEEKVKERTEELELSNADLIRSNQDLEQFAYVASHDLQEPLRTVANFVQLLEMQFKENLGASGLTYIRYASDGVKRMRQLIEDLLDYSKIGHNNELMTVADINELLESKLMDLSRRIEERNATVIMRLMPDGILCEASQISMVFYNLIGNAIKFNDSETPEVEIGWSESEDSWDFCVKDNGIGIPKEDADKIFEIFKRLHSSQEYEGTGIGLAMCKKIVERHGGVISFESTADKGTTFFFSISKNLITYERIGQKADGNLIG